MSKELSKWRLSSFSSAVKSWYGLARGVQQLMLLTFPPLSVATTWLTLRKQCNKPSPLRTMCWGFSAVPTRLFHCSPNVARLTGWFSAVSGYKWWLQGQGGTALHSHLTFWLSGSMAKQQECPGLCWIYFFAVNLFPSLSRSAASLPPCLQENLVPWGTNTKQARRGGISSQCNYS